MIYHEWFNHLLTRDESH